MAFVLDVNELMIKKTVLKLEVESINLKVFTILNVGQNHIDSLKEANPVDNGLCSGGSSFLVI